MAIDRLQGLLSRFSVSARMFHSGPLCGITDIDDNGQGQLHLVRRGPLEVRHAGEVVRIEEPSLLFYPRPLAHSFHNPPADSADNQIHGGPLFSRPIPHTHTRFQREPPPVRVLVIEDNQAIATHLAKGLIDDGHQAEIAGTAAKNSAASSIGMSSTSAMVLPLKWTSSVSRL